MTALILIDLQNDFVPGGALAVQEGNTVIPIINRLQSHFDLVFATQDWHPPDHRSFAANHPGKKPGDVIDLNGLSQVLWPVHCVQQTPGADFVPALNRSHIREIIRKGTDPQIDSYSGFFDNGHRKATGLAERLHTAGATHLFLAGLATDYCVKFTVLDALSLGFRTSVVVDACRGVNLRSEDSSEAFSEMERAGAELVEFSRLLST